MAAMRRISGWKSWRRCTRATPNLVFDSHPEDFTEITYCMDTGLLASGACRAAGRAATGRFWNDQVPTETCSHQDIHHLL